MGVGFRRMAGVSITVAAVACGGLLGSPAASAGPLSSVDDVLRVISQRYHQLPRADLDGLLTRSRTVLLPVERERGTYFDNVMTSACFMNDLVGEQGWDAANDWLNSQRLTVDQKATIRVQALKLDQSTALSDYGQPLSELICGVL